MEELEAKYRLLDEERRQLQAQEEERLQEVIKTYEIDREAGQEDIKDKEIALHELEAKYNQELRIQKEALKTAFQRDATRKREHEAEVEKLNKSISGLKRLKHSNAELTSVIPQILAPSALAPGSAQLALDEQRPDSEWDPAKLSLTSANKCPSLSQPTRDDKPDEARVGTAAHNESSDPQKGDYPGLDEVSDSSYVEEQSDEELMREDGDLAGNGNPPSQQAQSQPLASTRKTIPYDEVYEAARDPQAVYKHWIVEYPKRCGNWYIVRCLEHNLNWEKNALRAAGKHILGSSHTCSSKKANSAIKELGELVEGCDKQKADASNAEYQKALDQGYKPNNKMKQSQQKGHAKPARKGKRSAKRITNHVSNHEPVGAFKGIIDPIVGGIYHAWWDGDGETQPSWYLVVILPYSGNADWKEIGLTGSLFRSGLRTEIPNCFKVVKVATDAGQEALSLTWADGYQDGGSRVRTRQFPCLFLHDPLQIPDEDQEFALGDKAEVLAFRTAHQLRHRSTILPPGQSMAGVDAHSDLARDFEARLGAIRAKHNPAPEQEDEDNVGTQASLMEHEQQHANATSSVEMKGSPYPSPSDVRDLQHHSSKSYPSTSGDGQRDISDRYELTAWNPRVSHLENNLIGRYRSSQSADFDQRADRRTYHSVPPSTSKREGVQSGAESWASQAASRQAQPLALKPQNVCSPLVLQETSGQTAVCTSQSPRATSAFAGERRGPTALRPFRSQREDEKRSNKSLRNRASGPRKNLHTTEKDAVPSSAGLTSWTSSYSAMLRQPWRSPDKGGSHPENP